MAVITMDDLVDVVPAKTKGSTDTITGSMAAGKSLKIETYPNGVELVDAIVPAGKICNYQIVLSVELVDA